VQPNARHVRRFLCSSDAVSALLEELSRREALLARLRSLLPAAVGRHCTQATIEDGRLTLCCDSPAWVDRLRFLAPELLAALAAEGAAVRECRVRALPDPTQSSDQAASTSQPGAARPEAAAAVARAADALGASPLAESLRRLADTLRGS
jgi:hypothetical protein